MPLPGIKISYENGKLGTVAASQDGLMCICAKGAAVSQTLVQDTPYLIYRLSGLEALGVTATSHAALYKAVKEFYAEAEEGTPLYVVVYAADSMATFCDKDSGTLKGILQGLNGKIRAVCVMHPDSETGIDYEDGISSDTIAAVSKAQALAEWTATNLYAPIFCILDGFGYTGASDLKDYSEETDNRVCIVLGSTGSADDHAAVGLLAGRIASVSVQRNVGRVLDGAIKADEMYLDGDKVSDVMDDVTTIYDKHYICPRTHVGRSGYFWTDDFLCTKETDDYAHITARRTVDKAVRIGYDTLLNKLLSEVEINDDGTMQEPVLKSWQQDVEDAVNASMTANGELVSVDGSGCECFIDPTQNVRATSTIEVVIEVRPYGYARTITAKFGFKVES